MNRTSLISCHWFVCGNDSYVTDSYVTDSYVTDSYVTDSYVTDSYVIDSYSQLQIGWHIRWHTILRLLVKTLVLALGVAGLSCDLRWAPCSFMSTVLFWFMSGAAAPIISSWFASHLPICRKIENSNEFSRQIWICIQSLLICTEDVCLYSASWHRANPDWI